MSDRDLLVSGIALVVTLLIAILLVVITRKPPPPNINVIKNKGSHNPQTQIQQNHITQVQIEANTNVNINRSAQMQPAQQSPKSNGGNDNAVVFVFSAAVALITVAFFYLKYFDAIVIGSRALYFSILCFSFVLCASAIVYRDELSWTEVAGITAPVVASVVAISLLFSAQDLVMADVRLAAVNASNNLKGAADFYFRKLTPFGQKTVLASAMGTIFLLFHGLLAVLAVARSFVLLHIGYAPAGRLARTVLNNTEWCATRFYIIWAILLLGGAAWFIFGFIA